MGYNLNKWVKYINTMGTLELLGVHPSLSLEIASWWNFHVASEISPKTWDLTNLSLGNMRIPRHHQDDMKQFLGLGNPKLNLPSWKFNPFEKYESSQNGVHLPQGYGWKIAKKYWSCHHQASFVTQMGPRLFWVEVRPCWDHLGSTWRIIPLSK